MEEVLGIFSVELDGRFSSVRTQETNLGNWVCDVVLASTGADLVIINSGTLRSDTVHAPGAFTLRTLTSIVPMRDPLVVLQVTGNNQYFDLEKYFLHCCNFKFTLAHILVNSFFPPYGMSKICKIFVAGQDLLAALENSVSAYPKLEGRFPQVAGVCFAFDPSKPPGSRVSSLWSD